MPFLLQKCLVSGEAAAVVGNRDDQVALFRTLDVELNVVGSAVLDGVIESFADRHDDLVGSGSSDVQSVHVMGE
jgi:hypothetical protein